MQHPIGASLSSNSMPCGSDVSASTVVCCCLVVFIAGATWCGDIHRWISRRRRRSRAASFSVLILLCALGLLTIVYHGHQTRCLSTPAAESPRPTEGFDIGVGKADITGPAAEVRMMGFADVNQIAAGISQRLYARAFMVRKGSTRQVVVICDLAMLFQGVHMEVLERLSALYGPGLYTENNVLLSATHTHSGPGGYSTYALYDITIFGFIRQNFEAIVSGIVSAVQHAHNNLRPGALRLRQGLVAGAQANRSPVAYLENPLWERRQYDSNVDRRMTLLSLHSATHDPILHGLISWFAVHGTSLNKSNTLISGDNKGYAAWKMERFLSASHKEIESEVGPSSDFPDPVAAFAQAASGDVSPNVLEVPGGTLTGEGDTKLETLRIAGERQYSAAVNLLQKSTPRLHEGILMSYTSYVNFSNLTVQGEVTHSLCPAMIGKNFMAGTEDGRNGLFGGFEEGAGPNPLWTSLQTLVVPIPDRVIECQYPKTSGMCTGLFRPVPWTPDVLPLQVMIFGPLAIVAIPFEATTMAGRRIESAVLEDLKIVQVKTVVVAGLSNAYAGYLTTPAEYDTQHYEGASTHFGRWQLAGVIQELRRICRSIINSSIPLDAGPQPRKIPLHNLVNFQTGIVFDDKPLLQDFGGIVANPKRRYRRGETAAATFWCGHPKNDVKAGESFCYVDFKTDLQDWHSVLSDADFETTFRWRRKAVAFSECECTWNIDQDTKVGMHRLRHHGHWKSGWTRAVKAYSGVSSAFIVE